MLASIVLAAALSSPASVDLNEEEFRLYCGYLDEIGKPDYAKLTNVKRDQKIASKAKVKTAVLTAAVDKGTKAGATCDEIGKKMELDTKTALDAAYPSRISVFKLDYSDPSHVVALVSWLSLDSKKVLDEASTIANICVTEAKATKTLALRAINPQAPDKDADSASLWDARMTHANAAHIEKAKIADYAATRYVRLFDNCKTTLENACPPSK